MSSAGRAKSWFHESNRAMVVESWYKKLLRRFQKPEKSWAAWNNRKILQATFPQSARKIEKFEWWLVILSGLDIWIYTKWEKKHPASKFSVCTSEEGKPILIELSTKADEQWTAAVNLSRAVGGPRTCVNMDLSNVRASITQRLQRMWASTWKPEWWKTRCLAGEDFKNEVKDHWRGRRGESTGWRMAGKIAAWFKQSVPAIDDYKGK